MSAHDDQLDTVARIQMAKGLVGAAKPDPGDNDTITL